MNRFPFLILCSILLANFIQASEDAAWMSNCFQAAKYQKEGAYKKAIEEYTKAIESLGSNRISDYLNLYIERGLIYTCEGYSQAINFEKAIQDFNFVINHPRASKENRISALEGRAQVYLMLGKHDLFVKDVNDIDEMDPTIIGGEENENYVIFKVSNRLPKIEKSYIQALIGQHAIESEKDIIFTSSGMGMIKKSKSPDAPKTPFFE